MAVLNLALRSLWNRRHTALLTLLAITVSVTLLLAVERVRNDARSSFANTLSGTDLIVGARSGSIQLLLYSVFRIGNATNNLSWESYRDIAAHKDVAWTIPLALGDSHRGFRVLGTDQAYFEHYRYGRGRPLHLAEGRRFEGLHEAVLGAQVAEQLGYRPGQSIVVAHGTGAVSFANHDDQPFTVVGILAATGTPVDRTVHVSLESIEAIHVGWKAGVPIPGLALSAERVAKMDLTPATLTAALIGLDSKIKTFRVQRFINDYPEEPLQAVLPGVALQELWDLMAVAENALFAVTLCVVLVGLTGMLAMILAGLNERRREMAVLRSVGARPAHVFTLLVSEAAGLALAGAAAGTALFYLALWLLRPWVEARYGLFLDIGPLSAREWTLLGGVVGAGLLLGALPAYRAYRYSLADGLTVRL